MPPIPLDPQSLLFIVQGLRILTEYAKEVQSGEPMTQEKLQNYRLQWLESDKLLEADIERAKAEGR